MSETESTSVSETIDPESESGTEPAALPHPRIRTGAVVWGIVVLGVAAAALWLQTSSARRESVVDAAASLSPVLVGVVLLLTVGAAVLLIAGAALVRRAQIRRGGSR